MLGGLSDDPAFEGKDGGTTATVAVAIGRHVALVQLGDGGAMFYPKDESAGGVHLTPTHDARHGLEVDLPWAGGTD